MSRGAAARGDASVDTHHPPGSGRPDQARPADLEELVTELADFWHIGDSGRLFHNCSPRRVALVVENIRGYYRDDSAADFIALLPDWTAWLADHNATPAHLADRCRPYAHGESHKAVNADDGRSDYLARIAE